MTICVEDDGRGISIAPLIEKAAERGILDTAVKSDLTDEEAYQLIFERGLTTAENVTLNAGRGVGMSIVRESIENRGGSIEVASEPQQGTKFTLTFPVVSGPQSIDPPAAVGCEPLVLIVDDSNSIRLVTSRIVEALGCKAVTAENGQEALALLLKRSIKPDLILSDVEMPVMDGWQFLEHVKAEEELRSIPVVMVTSLSDDVCRRRASELGADDYHVKPLELKDFERVLSTFVETNVS